MLEAARKKVNNGEPIDFSEARGLMDLEGHECMELFSLANLARSKLGDGVDLCSIVNAKCGLCPEDCKFCAQSVHNDTETAPSPLLDEEEILNMALMMEEEGAGRFCIVVSGKNADNEDLKDILGSIRRIKKETSLLICASLGMLTEDNADTLKKAGVTRIHHNLESSERFFRSICTTHTYSEKINTVRTAKTAGLEVCCGGIIGMGESIEDRLDLAFTIKELDVDSVPINILNPIEGTDMENIKPVRPLDILKTIAVFRLILPDKNIRIAGGREKNLGDLQSLSLLAGANGLLLGNYLTTPGREPSDDIKMINDLGLVAGGVNV